MATDLQAREITSHSGGARARARVRWPVDDLATREVIVSGRRASYASGGHGVPVLFLHGWGLDHRVYQRSLRRLTARGCRVVAPSLPGFGRSAELSMRRRSLVGYAEWVDEFLDAVGADEPVLVLGHSFGGGVATRFAYDHPDRVRYLVLLNSVGDPAVFPGNGLNRTAEPRPFNPFRPMLDALRPPSDDLATMVLMQRALLENMSRHPLTVLQAAQIAITADLTREMAELARRELPVLVLWSDHDQVIPQAAFDTFCSTFGTDGHVVRGGHSWLLANPDVFGEVLDNVIHVQSAQRGVSVATANVAQLRELLDRTTLPAPVATRLLDGISPLWALSESPTVLAGDLALCHPRIRPGEVRAVARQMPAPNTFRLTVVATDRPGLLADTAATLAAERVSVEAASVMTWPSGRLAMHAVTVRSDTEFDEARWTAIGARLRETAEGAAPAYRFTPSGRARVTRTGEAVGKSIVRVTAPDRLGLLSAVCRWFADQGVSIEAADIATADGTANDVFLVDGDCDTELLARHLSADSASSSAAGTRFVRALLRCPAPRR